MIEQPTQRGDGMSLVRATYVRCLQNGADVLVEIAAEVAQDGGALCDNELLVIWTDETLATLASLDFDMNELVGAQEAIEEAYWASEREECRVANVRQRGQAAPYLGAVPSELSFAAMRLLNALRDAEQGAA